MPHFAVPTLAWGPDLVIALAIALQFTGFLFRRQVVLRLLVMAGSVCCVVHYATVADEPLWAAIAGRALLIAANLFGLAALLLEQSAFALARDQRHLLAAFAPMRPGQLRRLPRLAAPRRIEAETALTAEGETPAHLHFVVSGPLSLTRRGGPSFVIHGPCFIGEVAWLLGVPASATVAALPGAEVASWPVDRLHKLSRRSPRLEEALDALIAQDMARKVSASLPGRPVVGS